MPPTTTNTRQLALGILAYGLAEQQPGIRAYLEAVVHDGCRISAVDYLDNLEKYQSARWLAFQRDEEINLDNLWQQALAEMPMRPNEPRHDIRRRVALLQLADTIATTDDESRLGEAIGRYVRWLQEEIALTRP